MPRPLVSFAARQHRRAGEPQDRAAAKQIHEAVDARPDQTTEPSELVRRLHGSRRLLANRTRASALHSAIRLFTSSLETVISVPSQARGVVVDLRRRCLEVSQGREPVYAGIGLAASQGP
jgi:hypothetical protein